MKHNVAKKQNGHVKKYIVQHIAHDAKDTSPVFLSEIRHSCHRRISIDGFYLKFVYWIVIIL
jgi:hypothetical protein